MPRVPEPLESQAPQPSEPVSDKLRDTRAGESTRPPLWVYVFATVVGLLLLVVTVLHLTGNSFGGHVPPAGGH